MAQVIIEKLSDFIRAQTLRFKRNEVLPQNPSDTSKKHFVINDIKAANRYLIQQFDVWYAGSSDQKLDFYSASNIKTYSANPIYFRNCENYFWAKSAKEKTIKRTSADLCHDITNTLNFIIGEPKLTAESPINEARLTGAFDFNNLKNTISEVQLPYTEVEGWGSYRIDIDLSQSKIYPLVKYYDALHTWFVRDGQRIIAIITTDYVVNNGVNYCIFDTRYTRYDAELDMVKSCVDKNAFIIDEGNNLSPVDITQLVFLSDTIPHTEFPYDKVLAEPCVFFNYKDGDTEGLFGKSMWFGKIDQLDDFDQLESILSTSIRRSTPKVLYPVDTVESDKVTGEAKTPDDFDTKYLAVPNSITGDGLNTSSAVPTVIQPALNLAMYTEAEQSKILLIIEGLLSPADFGVDIAKKDNAAAMREKQRQTLFIRETICKKESKTLENLSTKILDIMGLMATGWLTPEDYGVTCSFNKFANPSKEERIATYLPMFVASAISVERFVEEVYEDDLSEEDKAKEIERLNLLKAQDTLTSDSFDLNNGETGGESGEDGEDSEDSKVEEPKE